jgi:hypothetical protein
MCTLSRIARVHACAHCRMHACGNTMYACACSAVIQSHAAPRRTPGSAHARDMRSRQRSAGRRSGGRRTSLPSLSGMFSAAGRAGLAPNRRQCKTDGDLLLKHPQPIGCSSNCLFSSVGSSVPFVRERSGVRTSQGALALSFWGFPSFSLSSDRTININICGKMKSVWKCSLLGS